MASVPSTASRSPDSTTRAAARTPASSPPTVDVTAITTRDDFLLELGQVLGGQAAVRPVDSVDEALPGMAAGKRGQLLVIDARAVADVRAAVDAALARVPRAVVLVFAEGSAERQLAARLKGSRVFAVLPTAIERRKTQAVLEGAIAEALAAKAPAMSRPAHAAERAATADGHPPPAAAQHPGQEQPGTRRALWIGVAVAATAIVAGAIWYFTRSAGTAATPTAAAATPVRAGADKAPAPTAGGSLLIAGKVDELLEKARLAMHDRRYTEPDGDNALLYYRSAAAADAGSGEARDGLQRVAGVLAGRLEEALGAGRLDEAAVTLANLKTAWSGDSRVLSFELRLYAAEMARTLADGNLERAAAVVRQAQQSSSIPAEQIGRWRAEVARRQEEVKAQHLASLVEERIRDGRLDEADDSARSYLQQLQSTAPANAATPRAVHALSAAYLKKARDAGLAKNSIEEQRWLNAARGLGLKAEDVAAFQRELSGARQKAAQAEGERMLQQARAALRDGRLTDPAENSAAGYLTQLQAIDPASAALTEASHELAKLLLERARTALLAGKSGDADLAQARRWGADPQDVLAVQQLAAPKGKGLDPASLAASLKRLRAPPPEYPSSALKQHIDGAVIVEYTVAGNGQPRDIHVVEATPPGIFDQAAINAVKRWRYAPLLVNGAAVEVPVKTRIRFELPK